MIQGIGNPLVAVYARCYLCRVGLSVMTKGSDTGYLRKNFECFLQTYQHVCVSRVLTHLLLLNIYFRYSVGVWKANCISKKWVCPLIWPCTRPLWILLWKLLCVTRWRAFYRSCWPSASITAIGEFFWFVVFVYFQHSMNSCVVIRGTIWNNAALERLHFLTFAGQLGNYKRYHQKF